MTTWQTIFGVEPPIKGSLSQFATARDAFETMRADAQDVVDQFRNFSDPGFVDGHLNDAPGRMVSQLLQNTDDGLNDLPRVASEAKGFLSDHYDRLVELRDAADDALARARTAWDRKNELEGQRSQLQSQISGLEGQIDGAEDDADTSGLDADLSGARSSLGSVGGELDSVQRTLDGIYGGDDSEYDRLVGWERERNDATVDGLDGISLGDLEDPGFWDKVGDFLGAIGDFLGGMVESLANLFEAFVTGDWATFFWELKSLMEGMLLILGTIALFTGIGGPLGLLLIGLSAASFLVNTGLYLTETPNPQTGQTVGLFEVGVSAVSAVFAGVTVLQTARLTTAFNRGVITAAQGTRGTTGIAALTQQRGWYQTFQLANAPGLRNGALTQFATQLTRNANNGLTSLANASGRFGTVPYRFAPGTRPVFTNPNSYTTVLSDVTQQQRWFTTVGTPASWEVVSTPFPEPGAPDFSQYGSKLTFGGFDGFNVANAPGGGPGTPVFASPTRYQVFQVASQIRQSPDVQIVPANP